MCGNTNTPIILRVYVAKFHILSLLNTPEIVFGVEAEIVIRYDMISQMYATHMILMRQHPEGLAKDTSIVSLFLI